MTWIPSAREGEDVDGRRARPAALIRRRAGRGPRAARLAARAGVVVGMLLVFVLGVVLGVLLHLGVPSARRIALKEANAFLAPSFRGQIRIERLGGLGLFGLSGVDVTIVDPGGRSVLVARGVRARVRTWEALESALFGKSAPLRITLSTVAADALDLHLDTDAEGNLELLNALAPNRPGPPTEPNARELRLEVDRVMLDHGLIHGHMAGAPPLDVDLDGLEGSLSDAPDALQAVLSRGTITARRIANGADVAGSLVAHAKVPSDPQGQPEGSVTWNGMLGTVATSLRASLEHDTVDAVLDAPAIAPGDVRTLWPDAPVDQPGRAHMEAHGRLSDIACDLHARLGAAALDASGTVSVAGTKAVHLALQARDIDMREFVASLPTSKLGWTAEVTGATPPQGGIEGTVALEFLGGPVGATRVPAASIHAAATRTTAKALRGDAEVIVREPGAPTRLTVHAEPKGDSVGIAFDLHSTVDDFYRIPEVRHAVRGSARFDAQGTVDLGARTLDARVRANADSLAQGSNRLRSVVLDAQAHGPIRSPEVLVRLRALDAEMGGKHFASIELGATGAATEPRVSASVRGSDAPDVDARATIGWEPTLSLHDLQVMLARHGEQARVTFAQVVVQRDKVEVIDARVDGLGASLTANGILAPGQLRVRAATRGMDLGRAGRLAHLEQEVRGGMVAFDVDIDLRYAAAEGHATVDVRDAAAGTLRGMTGHLEAQLKGRRLIGAIHASAPDAGRLDVDAQGVELDGAGPLSAATWRSAWGQVDFDVQADLGRLAPMLPPEILPVSEARGVVGVKGRVARADLRQAPNVTLAVNTDHLVLAAKTPTVRDVDGVLVYLPPPWRLEGIDLAIDALVDGGKGTVNVVTHARDAKGGLADLSVAIPRFPFRDAIHRPAALASALRTTAFDVKFAVPERGLGGVPDLLKQHFVSGRLKVSVTASGTLEEPKVDLEANLRNSRTVGGGMTTPVDADVAAHYDGRQVDVTAKAYARDKELLDASARINAVARALLDVPNGSPAWKASAHVHLAGFPIESISAIDDKLVSGALSGDITLTDFHANAHTDADLVVEGLRIGSVGYKAARIRVDADGRAIEASVRVDQADGFAEAKAHAVASWGAALAPALDPTQPFRATLCTQNFRLAAFQPFVQDTLDELDGRLDGETELQLDPKTRTAHLSGRLALSRGAIEAVAGGGEIHDLVANVTLASDGTVTLEKVAGAGTNGRFEGHGTAQLEGTTLRSAKLSLTIPSRQPIPLDVGGSGVGNVDGQVELTENGTEAGGMLVQVAVPHLRVALPEGTTTKAQALGTAANVRIGAHRGSPTTFVLLPLDPPVRGPQTPPTPTPGLALQANFEDVQVVRGKELQVDLHGKLSVEAADKTRVTGQITLRRGGLLAVQGKTFVVESGAVTFVGDDPSNPEVVVKAGWTAPEGTTIYANFVGPLKTGKVTLTSEPKLPQQEIVQLLLFGSPDGQQAQTPSGTPQNAALGAAGGEATQPLNHALGQLGLGAVRTNVDTSDSANPKPEVEVQIARDLSIQLAIVLGQPLPGVNPDTVLVSLDWRFLKKWTLSSTLGDAGTTIFDLLWQKRY